MSPTSPLDNGNTQPTVKTSKTSQPKKVDAIVIGSGPNGLAAGIRLAQAGKSVVISEAKQTAGGGVRSGEHTLPGFIHDYCSAVHPLATSAPYLRTLPLEKHGLEWVETPIALAHPFDDGQPALLYPSLLKTAETLGADGERYIRLLKPFVDRSEAFFQDALGPLRFPKHPLLLAKFGMLALDPPSHLLRTIFKEKWAQSMIAGVAAHSFLPLNRPPASAIGLMLTIAGRADGWKFPRGGPQKLADAMVSYFKSLGGEIRLNEPMDSIDQLPPHRVLLFDLTPAPLMKIAGEHLPERYKKQLERFRWGPSVFKLDYALSSPVPWKDPQRAQAGTLHLGGDLPELERSEASPWKGEVNSQPFVLVSQPSIYDQSRAPAGQHTLWSYCHIPTPKEDQKGVVPVDYASIIEAQIERFAPGFKSTVLARKVTSPADLEAHNPNCFRGDISGGIADLRQLFFRPAFRWNPYKIPVKSWYICSSSTPPGAGVHGLCGFFAAESALHNEW